MTQDLTRRERIGTAEFVAAMLLSGTIGIFVEEANLDALTVVFFRCLLGFTFLGLYCAAIGLFRNTGVTVRMFGFMLLSGVFVVANWVLLFESYRLTSISVATVVYHTQPFLVLVLGAIVFREKITANKVGWVVVAFAGLLLIVGPRTLRLDGDGSYLLGVVLALGAALLYALTTVTTKWISGVKPHLIALTQLGIGIPLLAPLASFGSVGSLGTRWGWLIGLGLIHSCIMYVIMYSGYQKLSTAKLAVLAFIYPVSAMVAEYLVYGRHVSLVQALGVPLILLAGIGLHRGWSVLPRPLRQPAGRPDTRPDPRPDPRPETRPGARPAGPGTEPEAPAAEVVSPGADSQPGR